MEFSGFFKLSGLLECCFGVAKTPVISTFYEVSAPLGSAGRDASKLLIIMVVVSSYVVS